MYICKQCPFTCNERKEIRKHGRDVHGAKGGKEHGPLSQNYEYIKKEVK